MCDDVDPARLRTNAKLLGEPEIQRRGGRRDRHLARRIGEQRQDRPRNRETDAASDRTRRDLQEFPAILIGHERTVPDLATPRTGCRRRLL